jgi:hypothetical protein
MLPVVGSAGHDAEESILLHLLPELRHHIWTYVLFISGTTYRGSGCGDHLNETPPDLSPLLVSTQVYTEACLLPFQ